MSDKWVLLPAEKTEYAFTWLHYVEGQAIAEAKKVASDNNCNVLVAKVIGEVDITPNYKPADLP